MNSGEEQTPAAKDNDASAPLSLEFDFAPSWARANPEEHHRRYAGDARGESEEPRRFGGGSRDSRRERDDGGSRDRRPPRRDNERRPPSRDEDRRGPPPPRGGDRPAGNRPALAPRDDRGPRPDYRPDNRRNFRPPREEIPQLPLDIRILPDPKALGAIIRRIQTTHRAYPLRDIARLFLDNPAAHQIRIEPLKNETIPLFQCRVCGMPALSDEEIRTHVLATHLEDFFDVSEVETDPPAGNFSCVARCGLSGELLGPPNHHSFNSRVQEMLRTRFANMTPEAYRSRIEMVKDPESIAKWRESCRKKRLYRRKRPDAPVAPVEPAATPVTADAAAQPTAVPEEIASPAIERSAAESIFLRDILPDQILAVKHMVCPAEAARKTPSRPLYAAMRDAFNREEKFPASLFFALRGAFRHRALHLFRANHERGPDFVVVKPPVVLDATYVVAELRLVLEYINQNPGCTHQELLESVSAGDAAKVPHLTTQLNTLVEKAHVIEYFNGVLAPPSANPVFRVPGERGPKPAAKPVATAAAAAASPTEAPATEPVAANPEPTAVDPAPVAMPADAPAQQTPEPEPDPYVPATEEPTTPATP